MSSKTTLERLVYMANQIARNLATQAEPAAATATHIRRYWDPRMKAMIMENGATGLEPIAAAAIAQLRT